MNRWAQGPAQLALLMGWTRAGPSEALVLHLLWVPGAKGSRRLPHFCLGLGLGLGLDAPSIPEPACACLCSHGPAQLGPCCPSTPGLPCGQMTLRG